MSRLWIWFVACVGVAAALPMQPHMEAEKIIHLFQNTGPGRNNAIEELIITALEGLREVMVSGSDDVPVLDPLEVDRILLDDSLIPIPGFRLEMNDVVVTELSTFVLQQISVESTSIILQRYHALIQVGVPRIDVNAGQYDLFVNFWGLDIFGKGDTTITVIQPWVKVDTNVNIRLGILGDLGVYLNIRDLRLDFGLEDIQFRLTGMFNDPSVDDFVNRFLRNLVMELMEFWAGDLSDIISPIVLEIANDILRDLNLIDFLS